MFCSTTRILIASIHSPLEIVKAVNDLIVRVVDLEGKCSGGDPTAGASLGASVSHVKESLDALEHSLTAQVSGLSV